VTSTDDAREDVGDSLDSEFVSSSCSSFFMKKLKFVRQWDDDDDDDLS